MNDDLISRSDAIEQIQTWAVNLINQKMLSREDAIYILESMPSAQPEQKKGEWINGRCDQCGGHAPFWPMASTYHKSKFCPDCGARMLKGEGNEND